MYKLLDLFSGIGGFSLGLERSGAFKTVAFCEIEPYCQKVLAKHWPKVPIYDDVRTITAERLAADGITVDAICGGFPCQDISTAGKRAGLEGERSGLWFEYARLVGELRPAYIIVENVSNLLSDGMSEVLGTLSELGYNAEWANISAAEMGAAHRRERIWIIAYSQERLCDGSIFPSQINAESYSQGFKRFRSMLFSRRNGMRQAADFPGIRKNDGLSSRVDAIAALGNAVIPQIPELIGRAIAEKERISTG